MKRFSGFNLIELLITVAIIAILTAIALPMYSHYLTRANRLAAEVSLEKLAVLLEQYYVRNDSYEGATLDNLNINSPAHYQLEIVSATSADFMIAAHPEDSQAEQDNHCATLFLNAAGEKSNSGESKDCWS